MHSWTPADDDVDDWMVVVPTRGDPAAIARIAHNIVDRLDPSVQVMAIRNAADKVEGPAPCTVVRILDVPGGGVSRARNAALVAATCRTVVFVDDDVVVSDGALRNLVTRQRETNAVIACARVVPGDAPHHVLFDADLGFDRGTFSHTWQRGSDDAELISPFNVWKFGVGATFAVDLSILKADGGDLWFDERLSNGRFCGGSEDVDFFYTAYVAGYRVCYVADAVVEHLFPVTAMSVSAKCRQYALADGAFYAKWALRVSANDVRGELTGWWARIARRRADRAAGRLSVPLLDLLTEPVYKCVGGLAWALVLRRSF